MNEFLCSEAGSRFWDRRRNPEALILDLVDAALLFQLLFQEALVSRVLCFIKLRRSCDYFTGGGDTFLGSLLFKSPQ